MMNKYNCDSLKNLPVPDELIEKALAIPETAEKAPAVLPWYRRPRMVATAASVVLVTVLGVSVFFFFGNKKPPVKEFHEAVEATVFATDAPTAPVDDPATEPTDSAEKASEPAEKPSETATETATEAARRTSSGRIVTITTITTSPTRGEPAQSGDQTVDPVQPVPPSTAPQGTFEKTAPTEKVAPKPVAQPTDPKPTPPIAPTVEPTSQPSQAPTDTPITPDPWEFLLAPTGDSGDPTAPTSAPSGGMFAPPIYAHGSPDGLTGSGKVYCALYDPDGALMGGGELLSPERLTTVIWNSGGNLWLKYVVPQGMLPDSGTYEIRLFNEDGREIARYADYVVVPV